MVRFVFVVLSIIISTFIVVLAEVFHVGYYFLFLFIGPLILIGFRDMFQTKHAILRNFPLIGHLRYILESVSPEIQQYFVERRTDGAPINKNNRSIIYQRSKNLGATHPFGTENDIYKEGYEFIVQSLYPVKVPHETPKVIIGGENCSQPYAASLFNISAMSFGSLSKNAIMALNQGAKKGGFYHNTGEGGISHYHLQGGDLVWQIGTGYFGCRNADGDFSEKTFTENAIRPEVKMIEVKLSQGAKPGHGGVLPGVKNTVEIAKIRGVKPHETVLSPSGHSAFTNPIEMLHFIEKLRSLSGGKPVGFKLCVGRPEEFEKICEAIKITNITPDFITVDGAEGGTGAAPLEFANYVGLPLYVGLVLVDELLKKFELRKRIKVIASGKVFSGFGIMKTIAMGADLCNSARSMMLAIGCIHAQKCNTNTCPTGVATQKAMLIRGLNVEDKAERTYNFHKNTIHAFLELMAATGANSPSEIERKMVMRMAEDGDVHTMDEIINTWNVKKKVIDDVPVPANLGNGNF